MKVYKNQAWKQKILNSYDKLILAWNVPVEAVDVLTTYGTTRVNTFGNPNCQPLFLFHGVGDDSAIMWLYNAKTLAEHFLVYAVDTIGGPGKSLPNKNYNKEFKDEVWIDEILDHFNLEQVNIAGVSYGGYLVQYYTLKRPQRVIKALALASSVPEDTGDSPMKTMIKVLFPEALFPTKKNIIRLLNKLSGENGKVFTQNPLIVEHYTHLMRGFNNMAMGYHKVCGFSDEQIALIKEKCMYLVGEADPYAIRGGKSALEKHGVNVVFYPKVGHGINHEISDEINAVIVRYFSEPITADVRLPD